MGYLTTHILDTTQGVPAAEVKIRLYSLTPNKSLIKEIITNEDGRCDTPILTEEEFAIGQYELEFAVGDYFLQNEMQQAEPFFLDDVVIRFGINDADSHYHVPLLISPYGYSTYRGS